MEIMYIEKLNKLFDENKFIGVYKDKIDLINNGVDFQGVNYDDNWKVKRLLNGLKIKIDEKIIEIFYDLDINIKLLDKKIKDLSRSQFKMILLVYLLLQNKEIIVLDYFDKGLDYNTKNKVINYLKSKFNRTLVAISNDFVFLSKLCNKLLVFENDIIVFNDDIDKIYKSNIKIDKPEIIKFIDMVNKKKTRLSYTVDNKELLKDIYRSIK